MKKIIERRYRNAARPHLQWSVNFRQDGKSSRRFFEKKIDAENFARAKNSERMRDGLRGANFSTALRVMATEADEQLKPFGATIREAVQHFVAYLKTSANSRSAVELVQKLLAAKEADGASKRHLDDMRSRLTIFADAFDGKQVSTFTSSEIDRWLRSLTVSSVTRNHYRRLIVLAFNFAMQSGLAIENPAAKTAKAKEDSGEIGILEVDQAQRLLDSAAPNMLPYISIGLFAGLRRAEIERLDWKEIDFDNGLITITAKNAKTARRRHVTILPNLRQWLWPIRKIRGSITPENFRKSLDKARADAGITEWPENALRHSYASYHLAHFKNAKALALELGHTNENMIFSNYRSLVKPTDAERYWNLKPSVAAAGFPNLNKALEAA
jgi:Site-specific recombinase XerD